MSILGEAELHNRVGHATGVLRSTMRALWAALFVLTLGAAGVLPAEAATSVSTTLTQTDGYGRIAFHWPSAVPHHTEAVTAGVLVIKFDTPFDIDTDEFLRQMPQMVALARQDADGKTLRLGLKFDYWLNVREAENTLYVDLLPSSWSGAPPALPADVVARLQAAAAAKAAAEADAKKARESGIVEPEAPTPDLSVRVARHDGMTRLVFDWNQPVLYSLAQQDGSATITFDRTAKVALAQIRVNPPPFLQSISATEREGRLSVFMKLDSGVVVSDFREDLGIVLDFKAQRDSSQPIDSSPDVAPSGAEPHVEATPPAASEPAQNETANRAAEVKAEAKAEPAAPVPHAPKSILPAAAVTPVPEKAKAETVANKEPSKPAEAPGPVLEVPKGIQAAVPSTPPPSTPELVADAPVETSLLKLTGVTTDNRSEITFPWTEPTGAAVFARSDALWVVFDRSAKVDSSALEIAHLRGFGEPKTLNVAGSTVIVFPITQPDMLVGAVETGTLWHVSLAHSLASTGRTIALTRNWSATGEGYVSADLTAARKIITIQDPSVHDTLLVATARGVTQALQASRSFIEFEALKSVQGLVVSKVADDLNVAAAPDAVIISRHNGLTLSAENGGRTHSSDTVEGSASPAIMDFAAWRGVGDFEPNRQSLMGRVAMAAPDDEPAARLDYARFLLAYGLAPEALTQLNMASKSDFKLEDDPTFRALRGVGEVMAHRDASAITDLSVDSLNLDPYVAGWRGMAYAELDQMDKANKDFDSAGALISSFEPVVAEQMHLAAANAALAMKDLASAHAHLGALPGTLSSKGAQARAYVLQARLLEGLKRPQEALTYFDNAISLQDREQTVRARLGKAMMLSDAGKLSDADFLKELNRLRLMWRGDDLERKILTLIADKSLADGKIVDALGAMRSATKNFPLSDEAQAMGAKMPEIFADYFMGPGSKDLNGVQALAFYYEFQDLTPIGQKGDELIRNLAERLVSIDLLAQAEVLLRYQVEQRLYGSVAKAQVAARLASVYLLDDKPKQALEILRSTMQNQLPADLHDKRQLIEARALASLKQYDLALDLLTEIDGDQADELRAEFYWEQQNWDAAGQTNEAMAQSATANQAPDIALSDDVRFRVMRAAIAYSLGSDTQGLARLRQKFGARMATSVDASAFAVVSDPIEVSGVAFRQLASRVASVNMIEKFVASFKDDKALRAIPEPAKAADAEPAKTSAVN